MRRGSWLQWGGVLSLVLLVAPAYGSSESEMLRTQAVISLQKGEPNLALKQLDSALLADTSDQQARYYRALANIRLGHYSEAIEGFLSIPKSDLPSFQKFYYDLGYALYRKGDYEKAADQFQRALKIKNDYPATHYYLALSYFKLKQYQLAVKPFRVATASEGDFSPAAYYLLAVCYQQLGDVDESEKSLKQGIKQHPKSPYAGSSKALLDKLAKTKDHSPFNLLLSSAISYDSNVALLPSNDLPVGADGQSDSRLNLTLDLNYQNEISKQQKWMVGYRFYLSKHADLDAFDLKNHRLYMNYQQGDLWNLYASVMESSLDGNRFLQQLQLSPTLLFKHANEQSSLLRFNITDKRYQMVSQEGYSSYQYGLSYRYYFIQSRQDNKRRLYLGAGANREDAAAEALEYQNITSEFGYESDLSMGSWATRLQYQQREYGSDPSDRSDRLLHASLQYDYPLREQLIVRISANIYDNNSTLASFSYRRNVLSAAIRWVL